MIGDRLADPFTELGKGFEADPRYQATGWLSLSSGVHQTPGRAEIRRRCGPQNERQLNRPILPSGWRPDLESSRIGATERKVVHAPD